MSVLFKPDKFGIVVTHRATSTTGRWIIFLGQHYNGKELCHDVGFFRTTDGFVQRLHFKSNKTGAVIEYDDKKAFLTAKRGPSERDEPTRWKIFGPDGKPAS